MKVVIDRELEWLLTYLSMADAQALDRDSVAQALQEARALEDFRRTFRQQGGTWRYPGAFPSGALVTARLGQLEVGRAASAGPAKAGARLNRAVTRDPAEVKARIRQWQNELPELTRAAEAHGLRGAGRYLVVLGLLLGAVREALSVDEADRTGVGRRDRHRLGLRTLKIKSRLDELLAGRRGQAHSNQP